MARSAAPLVLALTVGACAAPPRAPEETPRAWVQEGRGLYQALARAPVGMSRDGRRILESDGTLWTDDAETSVPTVASPVALSGDGTAVIGHAAAVASCAALARWTAKGLETVALGGLPGAVSDDGRVVVGTTAPACDPGSAHRAFVWSGQGRVLTDPLSAADDETEALALSADGSTLIGFSSSATTHLGRVFSSRVSTGVVPLTATRIARPPSGVFTSDDGQVVAVTVVDGAGVAAAFVWTAGAGGLALLPRLATRTGTLVVALSADGATVLALGTDGGDGVPFTWSAAEGPRALPLPEGASTFAAVLMNADASLIVGEASGAPGTTLAWDRQRAPRAPFADAPLMTARCQPHVTSLSVDGKTFAGACAADEGDTGFVARFP